MSIPAATVTHTVLADYALRRTSLAPTLLLPFNDGSGTTAADVATSPQNATYVGSPALSGNAPTYGNPSGTKCMTLAQAGTAICRAPTAGKLAHLVDGTLSHTTLIVVRSTDATNPNPFNYPVALGFANNFGTYDNMVQMCLNGKADGNPHGGFACFRWYTVANGSTGAEFNHGGSLFDGNTHTVAFVYSTAASGTLKIYVDGVLGTNATGVNTKAPALQTYFGIGTMVANNGTTLDRTTANIEMSDFQYFETELTAAQIAGWHSRAINGENGLHDAKRRFMSISVIDGDYAYTGGSRANAVITGGTIVAAAVMNVSAVGSIANSPTYGYILAGPYGTADPVQMGTNIAATVVAAIDANKPAIVGINSLIRQALNINAIALGYDTQPSTTDLFNLIRDGTHSTSSIANKARVNLMMPTLVAALGDVEPTAWYSNDEDLPISDACGSPPLSTMYAALLADPVMQARIADVRAEGAPTDVRALDAIIAAACYAESLWTLNALPNVPLAYYFRGRVAVPRYGFRYLGGSVAAVGVTEATIGCWAYQSNALDAETDDLIEDLAVQGEVVQMPVLDVRVNNGDAAYRTRLAARLNACRDRGVNDVLFFIAQADPAENAGTDLTYVSGVLATAQGARISVPVIQSASRALFGGNIRTTFDVAVNRLTNGAGYKGPDGTDYKLTSPGSATGDGTTTIEFLITDSPLGVDPPTVNECVSLNAGFVEAVSGGQDSDAVANFPCPISGIVSAVLDEAALTLTITLNEASNIDDPSQIYIKTTSGTEYQSQVLLSGSDTTTLVFSVIEQVSGSALPETMSMSASVLLRTSDSLANISISNYPITVIPAGGGWLPSGDNGRTHRLGRMNRGRST